MATIFTHAALPLLATGGSALSLRQRVGIAAVACLADLDLIGVVFDIRPDALWGHRGATHSLLFALVLTGIAGVFARPLRGWLLFAALSHPLVDLLSEFESGVALLAPWHERFHFFVRPVPALPLGVNELLGAHGVLVLLNEVLLIVVPFMLLMAIWRSTSWRGVGMASAAWLLGVAVLTTVWPDSFAPRRVRVFELASDVPQTPMAGVPGDRWLTRFDDLRAAGLFDRRLDAARVPWSSGFFPSWYGREAGRWKDSRLTLIARTIFGTRPPTEAEAKVMNADEIAMLSPIEKYDLLIGDLSFKATRESLSTAHNARPRPRFWNGLCNGISAAAMERAEPVLEVEEVSPSGQRVRFHPLDIKALLGLAYYFPASDVELGSSCEVTAFDAPRVCAMSPALLTLATLNAVGRAKQSFQLDVHATEQAQYYAVASAEVALLGEPQPASLFEGRGVKTVDVELRFQLSATTLPDRVGDVAAGPGRYEAVGLRGVPFAWKATLVLDAQGELIGGKWEGDGPDSLVFPSGGPELIENRVLTVNPGVEWKVIDSLARKSAASE